MRDALLGRRGDYLDLDFVVPEQPIAVAQTIAQACGAGFVVLDAERQIARVVFPQATVDFALQEGDTLGDDLRRRDFTINAIAYNPHTQELLDPLGGHGDLQRGCVRMVCRQNLQDDPLRLLRAYRQATQLNFQIDPTTVACVQEFHPLIAEVAAERVQSELSYLLHHPQGTMGLTRAAQVGLLSPWFPHLTMDHVARLGRIDRLVEASQSIYPHLGDVLGHPLKVKGSGAKVEGFGRSILGFVRLCCLLGEDLAQVEQTLKHLKASRWEIRSGSLLWRWVPQILTQGLDLRAHYTLHRDVQELVPALGVLAIVHQPPTSPNLTWHPQVALLLDQYFDQENLVAHPRPLVSGRDVMRALNLPSGPQVGEILMELQLAQAAGEIQTAEMALAWAAKKYTP